MSLPFDSLEQKASYGIGRQMGDQLAQAPFAGFSVEAALVGFGDALAGKELQVSVDHINEAFREIQGRLEAEQAAKTKELAAAGEAYLAENARRDGVTVTDTGLQYEVLVQGTGAVPTATDTVRTHYHGTLIDGTVFDSSVQRGEPAEFPVGGVISGWTEALQLMPVGSKWRLHLPYQLAYGERGAGGAIGPYSALVFEVELLDIL